MGCATMFRGMRKLFFVLAFVASPALAGGYSAADAAYVTTSKDPDVLNYVVCLATKADSPETLDAAKAACQKLAEKIGAEADDIVLNVMECGFKPGDASPDMGCDE